MHFKPQKVRCLWKPLLALAVQSSSTRYLAWTRHDNCFDFLFFTLVLLQQDTQV